MVCFNDFACRFLIAKFGNLFGKFIIEHIGEALVED